MGNESIIDTPDFAPVEQNQEPGGFDWLRLLEFAVLAALVVLLFSY